MAVFYSLLISALSMLTDNLEDVIRGLWTDLTVTESPTKVISSDKVDSLTPVKSVHSPRMTSSKLSVNIDRAEMSKE
jgi:hypothetical protein